MAMEPKPSIFSSLRRTEEAPPAPPPAPPPPPPQAAAPAVPAESEATAELKKRLEELEGRLKASQSANDNGARLEQLEERLKASQSGSDARAFRLETELRLAREEAVASLTTLREREEAQKTAQVEMEKLLRAMTDQKRTEEHDRMAREQMAAQKKRIDDLEAMLIESRQAVPPPDSREAVERAYLEIESLRSEVARLRTDLQSTREAQAAREPGGERERVETRRRLTELEKKTAQALDASAGASSADAERLKLAVARTEGWEERYAKLGEEFGRFREQTAEKMQEAHRLAKETLEAWQQAAAAQARAAEAERAESQRRFEREQLLLRAAADRADQACERVAAAAADAEQLKVTVAKAEGWEERFAKLGEEFVRLRELTVHRMQEAQRLAKETLESSQQTNAAQLRAAEAERTEFQRRYEREQTALRAAAERANQASERVASASRDAQVLHKEIGERVARVDEFLAAAAGVTESVEKEVGARVARMDAASLRLEEAEAQMRSEIQSRMETELRRFEALFTSYADRVERVEAARVQEASGALRREASEEAARLRGEISRLREEILGSIGEMSTVAVDARKALVDAKEAAALIDEIERRTVETERTADAAGRQAAYAAAGLAKLGADLKSALEGPAGPEALSKALSALRAATEDEAESLRAEFSDRMEAETRELQAAVADASRRLEERRQVASAEDSRAARAAEEALRRDLASAKAAQEARARTSTVEFSEIVNRLIHAESLASQAHSAAKRLDGLRESVDAMERLPNAVHAEMAAVKAALEKELRESMNRYLVVLEEAVRSVKR